MLFVQNNYCKSSKFMVLFNLKRNYFVDYRVFAIPFLI